MGETLGTAYYHIINNNHRPGFFCLRPAGNSSVHTSGLCRLRELPGMSRKILPALVHLPPRAGHAALHRRLCQEEPYTPSERGQNRESPPTVRTLRAKPVGFWRRDPKAKRNTKSSMPWVERTSTTFSPPSRGDGFRPFPLPMTSRKRNGSTRPPAAFATSREQRGNQPVSWLDPAYTFNTSCYSCHVSQLTMQLRSQDRHLRDHVG